MLATGLLISTAGIATASMVVAQDTSDEPVTSPADEPVLIDEAEALAIDAKMYAEAYNVPFEEAARRMAIMTSVEGEIAGVESAEGADFAGAYFDNRSAEFSLRVKTTKAERRAQRIALGSGLID